MLPSVPLRTLVYPPPSHSSHPLAAPSLRTFSATSVHCTASPPPLFAPPLHLSALCRRSLHPRTGDLCPLQVTFGGGGRAHGPTTASWLHRPSLNPSTDPSAHLSANLNPYPDIDTDASLTPAPVLTLILGLANRIPALTLALPLTQMNEITSYPATERAALQQRAAAVAELEAAEARGLAL